ncbi:MAG: uridine-cytidine kinase [Tunicatimonas sp.]
MDSPYVVGVTGGSASGKTQLLNWLQKLLPDKSVCLLSQDNYYKDLNLVDRDVNRTTNFDEPGIIEQAEFARDLQRLKDGQQVQRQEYTFNNPAATPRMLSFQPAPIIIAEGIFVFHFPEVYRQLDLKVFVDAKEHLKLHRRILRDINERGFSLEDVLYKYTHQVAPAYEKYIAPYQHDADLIIPNNQELQADECPLGAKLLATFLMDKISVGTTAKL